MFFDSHLHFDVFEQEGETDALLARADAASVKGFVAVGGSTEANHRAAALARRHPERIRATAGYDRDEADKRPDIDLVRVLLRESVVTAVGETGLDYHYHPETAGLQITLFEQMLELAHEAVRPVVVHSREADEDTLRLLGVQARRWTGPGLGMGVLHCFTGTPAFARSLLDLGLMISFSGIVTFRNAELIREAARLVPDEQLLIETDAPYLAPVPYRGRRNEPAYLPHVAETLAGVRGCSAGHIAEVTTRNARRLFAFQPDQAG